MTISIAPTFKCGHNCEYCLLDHKMVESKEEISKEEIIQRLNTVMGIIINNYPQAEVEFLLGDNPLNLNQEIKSIIEDYDKKYPNLKVHIIMNNVEYQTSIYCIRHVLEVEDLDNSLGTVFVVTEKNISLLTDEILEKNKNVFFILDSRLTLEKRGNISKKLLSQTYSNSFIFNTQSCLNYDQTHYDISLETGMITFSCGNQKTHLLGRVDFDNEKFILYDFKCKLNCEYSKEYYSGGNYGRV